MAAISLYQIEEDLQALLDTEEGGVAPEHEEEIQRKLIEAQMAAVDKRERVHQFMVHVEGQKASIDNEIKRLQALKKSYSSALDRIEGYIEGVIVGLGKDAKGKYKKLEGQTCVFSLRAAPDSVHILDEDKVPACFKGITIKVSAEAWSEFCDSADIDERGKFLAAVEKFEYEVKKKPIADALKANESVPGVELKTERYALQVK